MRYRHALIATAAAAVAAAAIATPAAAHRAWLLPSTTTLAGTSEYVTVDAAVSNDLFYADHVALNPDQVKVWAPDGTAGSIENPAVGRYRGTFDVKIDKPGTWVIGTERNGIGGSFKLNGETWRVGGRGRPAGGPGAPGAPGMARPTGAPPAGGPAARGPGPDGGPARPPMKMVATPEEIPAGATDIKLTETLSTNRIYVTADAPTRTAFKPTGKGLWDPLESTCRHASLSIL